MDKIKITSEHTSHGDDAKQSESETSSSMRKETRSVITPYAFEVAPFLFGTPLASPTRRAMALLIDLFLVALLSGVSGNALAILVAGLLWLSTRRLKREKRSTRLISAIRAGALLLALVGILGTLSNPFNETELSQPSSEQSNDVSFDEADAGTAIAVAIFSAKYLIDVNSLKEGSFEGDCELTHQCWQEVGEEFVTGLSSLRLQDSTAKGMLDEFLEHAKGQVEEHNYTELDTSLRTLYADEKAAQLTTKTSSEDSVEPENIEHVIEEVEESTPVETSFLDHSIIKWVQGLVSDLGLGFGWAAFYFTATMGLLKGQTIGKKLLGIKVIKLDGSGLNLWESFGRYGGYGAGLATGLTGFLQVYWDPNRQAIQDKISETLVIRKLD